MSEKIWQCQIKALPLQKISDMNTPSLRIRQMSASPTLAMAARAAEMKAQGIDVISLSLGEPDFNTPDHIKEAAKQAIDQNFSKYGPVPGYPSLRKAISERLGHAGFLGAVVLSVAMQEQEHEDAEHERHQKHAANHVFFDKIQDGEGRRNL